MKLRAYLTSGVMPEPSPQFSSEEERLRVLQSFEADALADDPELIRIVSFAAQLCAVPVSQITLVEDLRQFFLVREGIEERETPRELSFCAHALGSPEMLEVRDTTSDPRFAANPLVTGWPEVRFYAGQPLISDEGAPLGTICVVDLKPRPEGLSPLQREGMAVLAQAVMRQLNARRAYIRARRAIDQREARLRQVIEGVPQIAWSIDDDGNFDYVNRRWQEVTGAPPPRNREDWHPFVHPDDLQPASAKWRDAIAQGCSFEAEYRLRLADGSWRWVLAQAFPMAEDEIGEHRWFGTITDIDEFHRLSESRDLLSRELAHRIKNIFAVVIGLAMLKARAAPEHLGFAEELTATLQSLARAHEFVRLGSAPVEENLCALLAALFSPYGQDRVKITGADCPVAPRAATPIALVFHELATNSAKYGALSQPGGQVDLAIADSCDDFVIDWVEHGGPPAIDTGKRGFGTRLVEMAVNGQLQGSWERQFTPEGLAVKLVLPKSALAV